MVENGTYRTGTRGPWGIGPTAFISLLIMLAYLGVQNLTAALFVAGFGMAAGHAVGVNELFAHYGGLFQALALLAAVPAGVWLILYFIHKNGGPPAGWYLGVRAFSLQQLFLWLAVLVVMILVSDLITNMLGRRLEPNIMIHLVRTAVAAPLLWAAMIVAAPIFEELLFRGFLFRGIEFSRLGPDGAIILTAIGWALVHSQQYDSYEIATLFAMGMMLGYARARSGSIVLTILLHAANNLVAVAQMYYLIGHSA
ncbi:MAG: CPBP family intramembrane glutamic endopeptidase [Candidatus Sumerlaeia bacterium]